MNALAASATTQIREAATAEEIGRCHATMRELRTHISTEEEFIERVQRQRTTGYRLAYLEADGEIRAAAGFRVLESLYSGRFMYVDDLVTRERDRSAGFGAQIFDWLVALARQEGCQNFELDSGVQRFRAHRFYLMHRMNIASHHFSLPLIESNPILAQPPQLDMPHSSPWIDIAPGIRRQTVTHGRTMYQQLAKLEAGSRMPAHAHPHEQILYMLSGRIRLIADGQAHEMNTGDVFYLAGGVSHGVETLEESLILDTFSPPREDYLARDAQAVQG